MGIGKAALILMLGNIISRLLGLAREQVIAASFGGGAATDAFTAAGRVPTTIYDLLVGGMISAALIPIFSEYSGGEHDDSQWELFSAVLNVMTLALCVVALCLVLLARPVIGVIGGGYDDSTQQVAAGLLRLMVPAIVLMGMSGIMTAFLYARRNFVLPAFSTAAYNLGIIAGALLLGRTFGIISLVVGMLVGSLLQVLLQLPGLRRRRLPSRRLRHEALPRLARLYVPVLAGLVVSAVGVAIDTNLASHTGEGNLAAMRFATTLVQFPLGLVAAAVSLAVLPSLSAHASASGASDPRNRDDPDGSADRLESARLFGATLSRGMRLVLLGILPATAGLLVLRTDVIALLFQHGKFLPEDTARTSLAFLYYSPGIPAAALDQVFIFAFYARKNTITPVLVGLMGVGVYLALGLSLVGRVGMPALALANSMQWLAHAVVMFVLLWRSMGGLRGLGLLKTTAKASVASLVMVATLYVALRTLSSIWPPGVVGLGARVVGLGILGTIVYAGVLALLQTEELQEVVVRARSRVGLLAS